MKTFINKIACSIEFIRLKGCRMEAESPEAGFVYKADSSTYSAFLNGGLAEDSRNRLIALLQLTAHK